MFGLIVYGSLMHQDEIEKYDSLIHDIIPVNILEYKRSFNLLPSVRVGVGNYKSVLNIQKSRGNFFNGVCIVYKKLNIEQIDQREKGYNRIIIDSKNIQSKKNMDLINSLTTYAYSGFEHMIDHTIMPNVDYLKLCLEASKQHGDSFYNDFVDTTHINNNIMLKNFIQSNFTL